MKTSPALSVVACLAGSLALSSTAIASPITIQQGLNGYTGTQDAQIYSSSPTTNYGGDATMQLRSTGSEGNTSNPLNIIRQSLVKWTGLDGIASLSGSTVASATIKLRRLGAPDYSGNTSYVRLYAVGESWDESGVSWNSRDGVNDWSVAGATGSPSRGATLAQLAITDPNGTHLDGVTPDNDDWWTITLNANGVALVQDWIDNPSTNHGLLVMLIADAGDYLYTSEAADLANAPVLEVTLVPEPASVGLLGLGSVMLLAGRGRAQRH